MSPFLAQSPLREAYRFRGSWTPKRLKEARAEGQPRLGFRAAPKLTAVNLAATSACLPDVPDQPRSSTAPSLETLSGARPLRRLCRNRQKFLRPPLWFPLEAKRVLLLSQARQSVGGGARTDVSDCAYPGPVSFSRQMTAVVSTGECLACKLLSWSFGLGILLPTVAARCLPTTRGQRNDGCRTKASTLALSGGSFNVSGDVSLFLPSLSVVREP